MPLVFASFDVADGAVRFDGEAVPSVRLDEDELPQEWETPEGKVASTTAGERGASGLAFDLTIEPGEHELSVRYEIEGAWAWSPGGSKVRYALRPAASWKAVEALDVQLRCPAPLRCSPFADPDGKRPEPTETSLRWEQTEDGHRGHASGLPDGELAILVHMPAPLWVAWGPTASWIGGWCSRSRDTPKAVRRSADVRARPGDRRSHDSRPSHRPRDGLQQPPTPRESGRPRRPASGLRQRRPKGASGLRTTPPA